MSKVSSGLAQESSPVLLLVHALRVRGVVETDVLARTTGLPAAKVASMLTGLEEAGYANNRKGLISGWQLTSEGRAYGEELLFAELIETGGRDAIEGAYRKFLAVNQGFLGLCTDWQLRPDPSKSNGELMVNDHDDAAYDASVIARLGNADEEVGPICEDLAAVLNRFDGYRQRFASALGRVRLGEAEWFTKPMIDSYHTIWFELHENLLATLGIERAAEPSG